MQTFELMVKAGEVKRAFGADEGIANRWMPSERVQPGDRLPVIRRSRAGRRVMETSTWGFVPGWAEGLELEAPATANLATLEFNGFFRGGLGSERCIVPMTGYVTVDETGALRTVRGEDGMLLAAAGLISVVGERSRRRVTFAVVTMGESVDAPVLLTEEGRATWLERRCELGFDELRERLEAGTSLVATRAA